MKILILVLPLFLSGCAFIVNSSHISTSLDLGIDSEIKQKQTKEK